MTLIEVTNSATEQEFLRVHLICNQGNPEWIRPLNKDILEVFDRKKNKAFRHGEVIRWILKNDRQELIGRVAAFVSKKYTNKGDDVPVGGLGFFDCINDQACANFLFDTTKKWLMDRGMQAMDGPINFGERDKWWGLLVEGFHPPLYGMSYNPPYYKNLFEAYGFQVFYNQLCFSLPVADRDTQLAPRFYATHQKFAFDPDYRAVRGRKKELEKYAKAFCWIYNKAWARHGGNKEMSEEQAVLIFRSMKPVIDEDLMWFVYYKDEPIAMWISIPDINQVFKFLDGEFNWWAKLKFLFYKSRGVIDRFVGIIYGIVPEFQGTGVDYFMIVEAEKVIKAANRYKETELLWQGDFNPKIINITHNLGSTQSRQLITYRYLFDRNKPFKRHPVIE